MNLKSLYTTFDGRINRKPFWLGLIGLVIASIVITVVIVLPLTALSNMLGGLVGLLISLAFLYPACALGIKRLHDRGKAGTLMAVFIAPGLVYQIADLLGLATRQVTMNGQTFPVPTAIGSALGVLSLIVAIWALITLGIRRGTAGPNAWGPDPLAATQTTEETTL